MLWVLGLGVSAALVAASFRRPRGEHALLEATQDELRRTRAELDRLRTPVPAVTADEVPLAQTLLSQSSPTQFGRYQLLHVLGQGGMATVHLAVSHGAEGFRRFFVVKRLREDVARMPQVVHQFVNEARLGATLVHSNIVPIFDFGRVGNEFFLAQEYILGRDLNLLVRRARHQGGGGLPAPAVFHVAREILDALSYAHSRTDPSGRPLSIVHRDISPMNVMVTRHGEVKLLDFGIAHFERRDGTITEAGLVKGNVLFMSPEQARGLPIDARSDLFSLGLTLFYCLTGEPLYQQDGSDYDLLVRAAQGPGPVELARISSLSQPASDLLAKALRIEPAERFESAEEFLLALPASGLVGGATMLLELVERLVGTDLASEEARFADLGRAGEENPGPASERTTDPGKTAVQFGVPPTELHR
ncbi:MAG TPA: serine/threonine-protein kinase [Myxococcaceae bacterium]|nr:serine/threonine-protein kinase [Myxococcaceae bacterium]